MVSLIVLRTDSEEGKSRLMADLLSDDMALIPHMVFMR